MVRVRCHVVGGDLACTSQTREGGSSKQERTFIHAATTCLKLLCHSVDPKARVEGGQKVNDRWGGVENLIGAQNPIPYTLEAPFTPLCTVNAPLGIKAPWPIIVKRAVSLLASLFLPKKIRPQRSLILSHSNLSSLPSSLPDNRKQSILSLPGALASLSLSLVLWPL